MCLKIVRHAGRAA